MVIRPSLYTGGESDAYFLDTEYTCIKPAFMSSVSNAEVLAKAQHTSASRMIMCSSAEHPLWQASFCSQMGMLCLVTDRYVRNCGKPFKEWAKDVLDDVRSHFGSAH